MPFRLSLHYKAPKDTEVREVASRDTSTDDPVTAFWECQRFQDEVLPILIDAVPYFKRAKPGDIERRIQRINIQLPLGEPVMNGRH